MKRIIAIISVLLLAFFAVSCNDGNSERSDTGGTKLTVKTISGIEAYKVVRPDSASDGVKKTTVKLHKELEKTFDGIGISTDSSSSVKEILLGNTKRKESKELSEGLRYYDYAIRLMGERIVIAGGSDEALDNAVDFFLENLVDGNAKTVKAPIDSGYLHKENYKIDSMQVDGISISEFAVYNDSLEDSELFADSIRRAIGVDIKVEEKMSSGKNYIILDGSELIYDKYSIKVEEGNIVLCGSAHSLPAAMEAFIGSYLDGKGMDVKLTSSDSLETSIGKKETYTKEQLMSVIEEVYDDPMSIIIGEQVSAKKPHSVAENIAAFENVSGEMPGIIGIDLATYGFDLMNADDTYWSSFICDIVDYVSGGGIVTASAHWENPSGNYGEKDNCRGLFGYDDTLEGYEKAFADLITEGTEYNEFFKRELDENARFLAALEENGVPVIWRPLHEANGSWFWYCITQNGNTLDSSCFTNLWVYIYEYFTEKHGLTNLIWNFSPNTSKNVRDNPGGTMSTTYLFPGQEYCDMVGLDWYTNGELELMAENNYHNLESISGKPAAINEFGPNGPIKAEDRKDQSELYSCMDLYGNLYEMMRDDYSFVYLLTWGGAWGVEAMGRSDEFMQTDITLGQTEVKAMLDSFK